MVFSSVFYHQYYDLEKEPKTDYFEIKLDMLIYRHGFGVESTIVERSLCFSPIEFMKFTGQEEFPGKEELLCLLTSWEISPDVAQNLIRKMVRSACEARNTVTEDFKGVLAMYPTVFIRVESDDNDHQIQVTAQDSFDENEIQFKPASRPAIKSLVRKTFKRKRGVGEKECMICLEEFMNRDKIVDMPCGHEFHDKCAAEWLKTSHLCPLCRFSLPCEPKEDHEVGSRRTRRRT